MKYLLTSIIFFSVSLATADSSTCVINTTKNVLLLESTVTLEGVIVPNPMFDDVANINELSEDQKSVMLMLKPSEPVLLEQWSETVDTLSCSSKYVTLALNSQQIATLQRAGAATALGLKQKVTVTGQIRWSESSIEMAGNAVLMNITKVSVQK